MVAQVLDVLASAECQEFMLSILTNLLVSSTEVFVVSSPELEAVPQLGNLLALSIHIIIDVLADECVEALGDFCVHDALRR